MSPAPLRLLGLARRAGRLVWGLDAVCGAQERICLIVTASDAGASVLRNATRLSQMRKILHLPLVYDKDTLGHAVGKVPCSIAAVLDSGLARQIAASAQSDKNDI